MNRKLPCFLSSCAAALLVLAVCSSAHGQAAFTDIRWLPMTPIEAEALADTSGKVHDLPLWFTPYNTLRPKEPRRVDILSDRNVYLADDPVGQFLVYFIGQAYDAPGGKLVLEVVAGEAGDGAVVAAQTLSPIEQPKVAVLLQTGKLAPGSYRMRARLVDVPNAAAIPDCAFVKSAETHTVEPFPEAGVDLLVHEQAHVPDARWPITTGVPLPRNTARDPGQFVLLENGKPVAAQFTTRTTWHPESAVTPAQIKWLGVDFQAVYDGGKPRAYKLVRRPDNEPASAIASQLTVTENDEHFLINTAALQFKVSRRRFAGVEDVRLVNSDGSTGEPIVAGEIGGPFLSDERAIQYSSQLDPYGQVVIEEAGPVRVTICATGWYTSDAGERTCLYQTRISAFAGLPRVHIAQRTVITFDTDRKKLGSLGLRIPVTGVERFAFGHDGQTFAGDLPAEETVWLHQDRHDRLRVMQGEAQTLHEGRRSDGWASVSATHGTMTLIARNLWQLYPKEIELGRDAVTFHAWPRHGHVAFSEEEELSKHHIHKLFYAHQGTYLDLKCPQKYFDAFPRIVEELAGPRGSYAFIEQQDINALTGNAQGTAVSNEIALIFSPGSEDKSAPAQAALFKHNPHAISDPVYNGLTDVEGRFAGRNIERFPELERIFDEGFRGFTLSVDALANYGMWIWPDTHNNWSPVTMAPQAHRWWLHSHYQGVWEGTFLYLRSGIPWIGRWAADNSEHFMNIGTVNYDDPADKLQGKITGAQYHTKGFTPWGSPRQGERTTDDYVEVGAHFVNPDAFIIRYLLVGDHRALELAKAWADAFGRVALPPERSRECITTLGEMISYYQTTWDPQAILYIRDLADDMNSRPWTEVPGFPGHPMYHDRWVQRYWSLTRDPLLKERVLAWFKPDVDYAYPQLRALCWQWTGDKAYLGNYVERLRGLWRQVYDNPDDPLHGYGGRVFFFPTMSLGQTVPFFMQALLDADLAIPAGDGVTVPLAKTVEPEKDVFSDWFATPREHTASTLTAYLHAQGDEPVVTLEVQGYVNRAHKQNSAASGYLRIEDAGGEVVFETTVLATSQRPSATVTLDARKVKQPWRLVRTNVSEMKWTGPAAKVVLSPTPTP